VRTDTRFRIGQTVGGWQLYSLLSTDPASGNARYRAKRVACGHYEEVTSFDLVTGQRVCQVCDPKRTYEDPKSWLRTERQRQIDAAQQAKQQAALDRQRAEEQRIAEIRARRRAFLNDEGEFAPKPPVDPTDPIWDPYLSRWVYPNLRGE
jgi:hypothetical protein